MKKFTTAEIVVVMFVMLLAVSWIINIAKFFGMLDGSVTAMFVARIIGIFIVPLGSVLGFF